MPERATTIAPATGDEYDVLRARLRRVVEEATPAGSTVAVISRGDPQLVDLPERNGWHFPSDDTGRYAGFHPSDSADAIDHLQALRRAGATHLCLPATAFWWLEHYAAMAAWLDAHCLLAAVEPETGMVYDLTRAPQPAAAAPASGGHAPLRRLLDSLLPDGANVLVAGVPADALQRPGRTVEQLADGPLAVRRLAVLPSDRETFVAIAASHARRVVADGVADILARRARPLAHRAAVGDLHVIGSPARAGEPTGAHRPTGLIPARADELRRRMLSLGLQIPPTTEAPA